MKHSRTGRRRRAPRPIDELRRIAAETAATSPRARILLVWKHRGKARPEALSAFALEPFSQGLKTRFQGKLTQVLAQGKGIRKVLAELGTWEREMLARVPRLPPVVAEFLAWVRRKKPIPDPEIYRMFLKAFPDALRRALYKTQDGTYYLITGDIPAMWLRDSSLQIHCYLPFATADPKVAKIFEGIIKRQAKCILKDPYAYAFFEDYSIRRRKFCLDSPLYFLWTLKEYWKATHREEVLSLLVKKALDRVLDLLLTEQHHTAESSYDPMKHLSPNDKARGLLKKPNPVAYTGMVWSGFRPSDDPCYYNYHLPDQFLLLSVIEPLSEFFFMFGDEERAMVTKALGKEVKRGIRKFGVVKHPTFGRILAYEVDGLGNSLLMDDANPPSLLSIPYFSPVLAEDPLYRRTREFVLSRANPYWVEGKVLKGVGSPHRKGVWLLSVIFQGLTGDDVFPLLKASHAGTYLVHEAVDPNDPSKFTRPWFSMGNSLFSELVIRKFGLAEEFLEKKRVNGGKTMEI